jgi:hypothetical protein
MSCPKCNGPTESGFIPDIGHAGYHFLSSFTKGEPEKSFLSGYKPKGQQIPLTAVRCTKCGYVELYAKP